MVAVEVLDAREIEVVVVEVAEVDTSRAADTDSVRRCPEGSLAEATIATRPPINRTASQPPTIARRRRASGVVDSVPILIGGRRLLVALNHSEKSIQ